MDIVQIVVIGIITSLLYIILKEINPPFAFILILITTVLILVVVLQQIGIILDMVKSLGTKANVDGMYMQTILKIIGISYITEIGASLTKDAGLESVAAKIELAGKIFILILAVPIIKAVIEAILTFVSSI